MRSWPLGWGGRYGKAGCLGRMWKPGRLGGLEAGRLGGCSSQLSDMADGTLTHKGSQLRLSNQKFEHCSRLTVLVVVGWLSIHPTLHLTIDPLRILVRVGVFEKHDKVILDNDNT